MAKHPSHSEDLTALKRIEGQVRGIQKMIREGRYCVDILTQLSSVDGAILRVQDNVLGRHLNACVARALKGNSQIEKQTKIGEVLSLIKKFRKSA